MKKFLNQYLRNEDGVAAIEFVLIMPVFIIIFMMTLELSNFIMVDRRASFATDYKSESLSRVEGNILTNDINQTRTIFPLVNITSSSNYRGNPSFWALRSHEFALAGVDMERVDPSCEGNGCVFTPDVTWLNDAAYYLGGVLSPYDCNMSATSSPRGTDSNSIPESHVGRSSLIMVRLAYEYQPLILKDVIPVRFHKKESISTKRGFNQSGFNANANSGPRTTYC